MEAFVGTAYFSVVIFLALILVIFFGALLQLERKRGHWMQMALFPIIAMGITAATLLSGRSLRNAAFDLSLGVDAGESVAASATILRLLTFALLSLCAARIAGQWLKKNHGAPEGGMSLFVALLTLFLSHNVLSSMFGTQPVFIHNLFYTIFAFAALYAARRDPLEPVITTVKVTLYALMLLSLVLCVTNPDMALQPGYKGWIPVVTVRLWGVGSNANSIGPLALLALLMEYMQPTKMRSWRWICISMTLVVFLLAQSKTVWFVSILLIPVLAWYRAPRLARGIDMRLALAIVVTLSAACLLVLVVDPISIWDKLSTTRAGSEAMTLTGRSQIWAVAIDEWSRNPLFGYGPAIWGPAYRMNIGMQFAFSAHNQFLQSLSAAGVIGLFSLMTYLGILGLAAYRGAPKTRGVSMAFFLIILFRCLSETPLNLNTLFNGDTLAHLVLFAIALRSNRNNDDPKYEPIRNFSLNKK
ncbi:O-antigen ligase family protein [Rhodoferax sp.]|uniref:O-antigen ligase family protein n=1 Tax=Rhodoferax sp. TaxID=50421 RepID=UPI0025E59E64|nr:O-antigen ligase family protein [Rhodoferax sp.]